MNWDKTFELALTYGLKPDEFWNMSMREWILMQGGMEERARREWMHTSSMMALQYNMGRTRPGQKTITPDELNPLVRKYSENENINTKEDVMELANRLQKL